MLIQLQDDGYIKGLAVKKYVRQAAFVHKPMQPRLTLKGTEYLSENSLMKKAANLAKGIAELIP